MCRACMVSVISFLGGGTTPVEFPPLAVYPSPPVCLSFQHQVNTYLFFCAFWSFWWF